jgi:hypothetical protein
MTQAGEAMLARLATLAGIAPSYRDTEGRCRALTPANRAGILRALGYDPDTPGAVRDAVAALEQAPWRAMLAPLVVLAPPGAAPEISLVVAARARSETLRWRIALEDGAKREGSVALADLALREDAAEMGRVRLALPLPTDLPPG